MKFRTSILATVAFELSRVFTFQRMMLTGVMSLFPPMMIWILNQSGVLQVPEFVIAIFCGMICLLSLLLWATPNVYAELEGKSWTFVTSRPYGRLSIVIGKFLISAIWSFVISWIALTLSIVQIHPDDFVLPVGPDRIWLAYSGLLAIGSLAYSAVFSFFGVAIQRRAMVVAVGYVLVFEIVLALIPANIGKITISYHLFCLLNHWLGWIGPDPDVNAESFRMLYGLYPMWVHLTSIFVIAGIMLVLATVVIRAREYVTLEDSQI